MFLLEAALPRHGSMLQADKGGPRVEACLCCLTTFSCLFQLVPMFSPAFFMCLSTPLLFYYVFLLVPTCPRVSMRFPVFSYVFLRCPMCACVFHRFPCVFLRFPASSLCFPASSLRFPASWAPPGASLASSWPQVGIKLAQVGPSWP